MYDRTLAVPREERGRAVISVGVACCMYCHRLTESPVPLRTIRSTCGPATTLYACPPCMTTQGSRANTASAADGQAATASADTASAAEAPAAISPAGV
ncbi:hypothetical protein G3I34_12880 [Streptomyces sp. SID8014]|uniref:hypothetical protein n=1 Tax=Streptomyces sp. SID8014 TaxID=2706097 RepID=UPI0013B75B16|nr:hypothetical protein [Streptomyces sp. SID8014]NEC13159.1 hypothetical protein [Streptomyces sp. SID8014]